MPSPKKRAADAAEEPAEAAAPEMPPGLVMEAWPIDRLVPYVRNPRAHAPETVARMAGAIREFGFKLPVLALSDGTLVDGHLRLEAARQLGLATLPVVLADDLTPAQVKAFRILSRNSATWSPWDDGLLRLELAELEMVDFDLGLTGFGEAELAGLMAEPAEGLTDPDELPEPPPATSETGDVWLLGRHRLVVGDCTSADDVASSLNGVAPHLCVTDPPYGVDYDPGWRGKAFRDGAERAEGKVRNDHAVDWREAFALFPGDVVYAWAAPGPAQFAAFEAIQASGFEVRQQIIWGKSRFAIGRGHYHYQHEPCWYAVKKGGTGHWSGDRSQTTLWQIDHRKSETGHSTQKPVECMKRPIENNSSPGQAIYDPFVGSGTTIIACEMTGRACHAIELDPSYVDLAVIRWMTFVGEQARLEATGQTFGEVQEARGRAPAG